MRRRIYYKSDFKEVVSIMEPVFINAPFRFTYTTTRGGVQKFEASWDGHDTFKNCSRYGDGRILVTFGNHGLPCGPLTVERRFYVSDTDFQSGTYNAVNRMDVGIDLYDGESDPDDSPVSSVAILNAIRGDQGLSAYEVAVKNGFEGSEEEWLDYITLPDEQVKRIMAQVYIQGLHSREAAQMAANSMAALQDIRDEIRQLSAQSDIEAALIAKLAEATASIHELQNKVRQLTPVTLTKDEYDAMAEAGTIDNSLTYYLVEQ